MAERRIANKKRILSLKLLAILFCSLNFENVNSQLIGNYTLTNTTGDFYVLLTGETIVSATNGSANDGISAVNPIGFNFNFGGSNFTEFKMNTNGWITFNTASVSTTQFTVINSTETDVVAPFNRDLITTSMGYLLTGASPNQILKIQWNGVSSASANIVPATGSFQLWLYEGSNNIEFRYSVSPGSRTGSGSVQVGIKGISGANQVTCLTGFSWITASMSHASSSVVSISTTVMPASNRIISMFPPPVCSGMPSPGNTNSTSTSVCASTNFTLSLQNLIESGYTYQWQSSINNIDFSDIPGATLASLTTNQTIATFYRCNVTCTSSGLSAASNSLMIQMVCSSLTGGNTVSNNNPVCSGSSFTVSLSGATTTCVSFQWQSSPDNSLWSDITGATNSTRNLTQTSPTFYRCIITCLATGVPVTSNPLQVMMTCDALNGGNTVSTSTSVCSGGTFTLSVTGQTTGTCITRQWQTSSDNINWNNITGALAATLVTSQTATNFYRCLFTCSNVNTAFSVPIQVNNLINCWVQVANYIAIESAASFSIGNRGYVGTGLSGSQFKSDFWEYDINTNVWTQKVNFPGGARQRATGLSIGSKGYIGVGVGGGGTFKDFWEYDPTTNTWTRKADFGGTARQDAVGFSIGSKGYVGTGNEGFGNLRNDFWEYNPATNTWVQKSNFGGTPRSQAMGFGLATKGYIGTGSDGNRKNDLWEYDPLTNTWIQKSNFAGSTRTGATGFAIGNRGYLGLGNDGANKNDFWEYNPENDSWLQLTDYSGTARTRAFGFGLGPNAVIGGGFTTSAQSDVRKYFLNYCSGIPVSGTTTANVTSACTGEIFTLGLNGAVNTPGITYQWQSSLDDISYFDIVGAISSSATVSQSTASFYRCRLTCSFSNLSSTSASLLINTNCTSVTGGTTVSSVTTICAGVNFNLSLNSNSTACVTYQWQSSFDDIVYNNIVGANSSSLIISQSAATFYRCLVSCIGGAASAFSVSRFVSMVTPIECYCIPPNNTTLNNGNHFTNVKIIGTSLNNPSANNWPYISYPAIGSTTALLNPGGAYTIELEIYYSPSASGGANCSAWIDFNQNQVFEPSEQIIVNTSLTSGFLLTSTFSVPANAATGQTRLRLRTDYLVAPVIDPCSALRLGETEDYIINIPGPCSGTPDPGATVSSTSSVCPSTDFILSLENNPMVSGLTYQWQISPDNIVWSNGPGASNFFTYTASQTSAMFYRCLVTCSGNTGISIPVQVNLNNFMNCYCTPIHSAATFPCTIGVISNVSLNTLNHNPPCISTPPFYFNNPPLGTATTTIETGGTYSLSITSSGNNNVAVWIDYNRDGIFSPSEFIPVSPGSNPLQTVWTATAVVSIPRTALTGQTRMRVTTERSFVTTGANSACATHVNGQTEDYAITLIPPAPCSGTPTPGNTVSTKNLVCVGSNFTLSIQNDPNFSGIAYQWRKNTGSGFTDIAGATGPTLTTTQNVNTVYHCVVSCSNSLQSGNSTDLQISMITNIAGNTVVNSNPACSNGPILLSLTNECTTGATFQWQRNTGTGFVDIPSATQSTLIITQAVNTTYHCVVTNVSLGITHISSDLLVTTVEDCGCFIEPDASYSTFPANDDGSIGPIALPFNFTLYGVNYTSFYINNNGNITFNGFESSFDPTGFPSVGNPMIAPFWSDVDTRVGNEVKYKINPTNAIISWPGVRHFFAANQSTLNTFQVIITNGNDPVIGIGNNVAFYYETMNWTTGSASGGANGFGGADATVGINKGDGISFAQVGRFNQNNFNYVNGSTPHAGVHYLDFKCFYFNVGNSTNLPPSVSGHPANNTVNINCGETTTINLSFLPPEVSQTVTTVVNTGGLCNTTVNTTNGPVSTSSVSITGAACNAGTHVISFVASDNFSPAGVTTVNITVNVNAESVNAGTITGLSSLCIGASTFYTSNGTAGGTWSSDNTTIATIDPVSGEVTAHIAGIALITYTVSGNCGSVFTSKMLTVAQNVNAGTVSGSSSVCPGTISQYSSNGTAGGIWTSSDPLIASVDANGLVTSHLPGIIYVTYSLNIGCGSPVSSAKQLIVNAIPTATITSENETHCGIETALISMNLVGTAPFTVMWSDGFIQTGLSSGMQSRSVSPTGTTTYSIVSVSDATICTGTTSGSVTITVNNLPTAVLQNATISNCGIETEILSMNLTGMAPITVTWSDGFVQTGLGAGLQTRTVTPTSTTSYSIINLTDGTNCNNTGSGNLTVTVNPIPVVNAGTYPNQTTISPVLNLAGIPTGGTFTGPGVSSNNFNPAAAGVGSHTIIYTFTDPLTSCINSATTTIVVTPGGCNTTVTITASEVQWCYGIRLTANVSNAGSYNYEWRRGTLLVGNSQTLDLTNADPDGVYTVYASGPCSSQPVSYNYERQNLIQSYVLVATKKIDLDESNIVQQGSLGVINYNGQIKLDKYCSVASPGAFVKASNLSVHPLANVPLQVIAPAEIDLPVMLYNTTSTAGLANLNVPANSTGTLNGNYNNVTVKKEAHVTFTGSIFGKVHIEQDAVVVFTAPVLNFGELNMGDGHNSFTELQLTSDAIIKVKTKVSIGQRCRVNDQAWRVIFYVGDNHPGGEKFSVNGKLTSVIANVFVPGADIKVNGDANNPCYMTGLFIAENIKSVNNDVVWNAFECIVNTVAAKAPARVETVNSVEEPFDVRVYPNPSNQHFIFKLKSGSQEAIKISLFDIAGRKLISIHGRAGDFIQIGGELISGTYIAEIIQGKTRKFIKLIKQ